MQRNPGTTPRDAAGGHTDPRSPVRSATSVPEHSPSPARTFLFTDIEDSTVLWELDPEAMAAAVARHDRIVTGAVEAAGGRVVQRVGDAMDAAFDDVRSAVGAAVAAQRELASTSWGELGDLRVRMAVDVGEVDEREGKFFGAVLNRAGRMLAAGHGGQILLSADAAGHLDDGGGLGVRPLGRFRFKGLTGAQEVFQLTAEGLADRFPPLRVDHPAGDGTPRSGTVWGYELREEVGAGRLGVVHRGVQPSSGREVAIRVVRPELVNDAWFVRRFEAEARIVDRLDHVHLVGLRDFWRDPDGAYLVSPWFEGGSLDGHLGRPWDVRSAARLISQIGSALVYLHERGLVHGGVTPSNVLLDADGGAHLSDAWLPARLLADPSDEGASESDDVRGLALLVVAVLTGRWPDDGAPPPAVSELRPEVEAEVDQVIARAVSPVTDGEVVTARGLLEVVLPALEAGLEVAGSVRNPYKGLAAFGEGDAVDFFGREDLLTTLTAAVAQVPLVAVVGPSGSGKSSVVRAGLLPAVHRGELGGDWLVTDLLPGARPFEEVEAALLRVAVERPPDLVATLRSGTDGLARAVEEVLPDDEGRLLILIDQFEELFSLVDDETERQAFLDGLVTLAREGGGRTRIVLTMRADFFDRPLDYPEFGELLKEGLVPVTPLGAEGLEAAITGPARNVGVEVEAGLVSEILADVGQEPGRLPLVQFALTELFERRDGSILTLEAYHAAGGVTGALARRAEAVYGGLSDDERDSARQILLRLVALGEGTEDTRRRVPRSRLVSLTGREHAAEVVLERFGEHRLLSFDRDITTREPTVEVAHEALLRHWPRLRTWIDEAREDLRSHRRLRAAVTEWREAGEDEAYLLAPARVEAADAWLATSRVVLSDDENRYLAASRARRDALDAAEAERAAHEAELERRAVRRLRTTVGVLAVGVAVAIALTAFALVQRGQADQERAAAEEQRVEAEQQRAAAERSERVATARGLASAAVAHLTEDPELSILLGIEAVNTTRDVDGDVLAEAQTALRRGLLASQAEQQFDTGSAVSVAADGRIATLSVDGTLTVWDPDTWEPVLELEGQSTSLMVNPGDTQVTELHRVEDVDFSPDGSAIVVADADLRGAVRDATTGEVLVELDGQLTRPTFSPDGELVAAVYPQESDTSHDAGRTVGIWDATTGELLHELDGQSGNVWSHAISADGSLLLTGHHHTVAVQLWDVESGEVLWSVPQGEGLGQVHALAFHPDGERFVLGAVLGVLQVRSLADGELLQTYVGHDEGGRVAGADFSEDGHRLVTGGDRNVRVWDVETGEQQMVLRGHTQYVQGVAFTDDDDRVVSTSEDGTTRVWDVRFDSGHEYAALPGIPPPAETFTGFSPDGRHLPVPEADGTVRVWEVATLEEVLVLPHDDPVHIVSYSPDGELLATAEIRGYYGPQSEWVVVVHLWDAGTGDHLGVLTESPGPVFDIVFSPDGSVVLTAEVQELRARDVDTGEELFSYFHDPGLAIAGAYTPDGERIVFVGQNAALVLDAVTGEVIHDLIRQETAVLSAVVVDGDRVVTADLAGRVRLHDISTGEEIRTVREEAGWVTVDVWEDLLAIGTIDRLALRDLESGDARFEVSHGLPAPNVRISPDGRYIVAPTWGGPVHVHVIDPDDLLRVAHDRLTRWWTDQECDEFLQRACPDPVS